MSELHSLNVTAQSKAILEAVNPAFALEGLMSARTKTIAVVDEIRNAMKFGMNEGEARKLAMQIFLDHGVKKHWHRVYIRIGAGTCKTFNEPDESGAVLTENDPVYLDVGPVWKDETAGLEYEGDYGDTFIFGKNPAAEKVADAARALFRETQERAMHEKWSGEQIYRFMNERNQGSGYTLHPNVLGHRLSDFPHQKYAKSHLSELSFQPSSSLWVLEVHLTDPVNQVGAFFEDLL